MRSIVRPVLPPPTKKLLHCHRTPHLLRVQNLPESSSPINNFLRYVALHFTPIFSNATQTSLINFSWNAPCKLRLLFQKHATDSSICNRAPHGPASERKSPHHSRPSIHSFVHSHNHYFPTKRSVKSLVSKEREMG